MRNVHLPRYPTIFPCLSSHPTRTIHISRCITKTVLDVQSRETKSRRAKTDDMTGQMYFTLLFMFLLCIFVALTHKRTCFKSAAHKRTCSKIAAHKRTCSKIAAHKRTCSKIAVHKRTCSKIAAHKRTCPNIAAHKRTCSNIAAHKRTCSKIGA